jgi:hypothetical protein
MWPSLCAPTRAALVVAALLTSAARPALAQSEQSPAEPAPAPRDIELNLINLPTTASVGSHHSYFRLTHRFARDLRRGSFGNLAEDLFSLDSGAIMGLEYRYGITGRLQAGLHRSILSKTMQAFTRYDALAQGATSPVGVSVTGAVEGTNNLRRQYQPTIAATLSRAFGRTLFAYLTPAYVGRTHVADFVTGHDHDHGILGSADEEPGHRGTFVVGTGARLRVRPTVYVTAEYSPRVSGYRPNRGTWGAAVEKRAGGHTFQMNFTNSFGTTFGQVARGGSPHDVYLGFNLTRKF